MPVPRRACDHCRAHKLRCQWLDDFSSCSQCKTRNKLCAMPTSSWEAVPTSKSHPSENHSSLPPSPSRCASDRDRRLKEIFDELKDLLFAANNPSRPVQSQDENISLPVSPSIAQKRKHGQMAVLDDAIDHGSFKPYLRMGSSLANTRAFASNSFHVQPMVPAIRDAALTKKGKEMSQPSMALKNCVSGRCYLPPPDEGSSLVKDFLHDFNSRIPLLHPETIYTYVYSCYSGAADKTPLYWVLTYIVLAIGHRMRVMSLFAALDDTSKADWYLSKCLAVLPDLLLQQPTLPLVQALLGVAILLQTSDRSRKAALFVSTAVRMAQDLAYNEVSRDRGEEPAKGNQEARVFWIAFILDTDMNLRAIRPNTQKLVDISVPVPELNSLDTWSPSTSDDYGIGLKVNFFVLHARLAIIQAEALEELFSVKARLRSPNLTSGVFKSILSKLDMWRKNNPLASSNAPSMLKAMYRSDVVHSIIVEASYFEILYQLYAANALDAFTHRIDVFSPEHLKSTTGLLSLDIYADAQRLLVFASMVPQGDVSVTWVTMQALIAALCTVLAYHVRSNEVLDATIHPSNLAANILLYKNMLGALEDAAEQGNDCVLTSKINVCRHLFAQINEDD